MSKVGKNRKYSNALVGKVHQSVQVFGIKETAEIYSLKPGTVDYLCREYDRRLENGETFPRVRDLKPPVDDTPKQNTRVYLKPRVPIYSSVQDAWKDLETKLDDRQLDTVHKFYNTVLFETGSFDSKFMIYEQD